MFAALVLAVTLSQAAPDAGGVAKPAFDYAACANEVGDGWDVPVAAVDGGWYLTDARAKYIACKIDSCEDVASGKTTAKVVEVPWIAVGIASALALILGGLAGWEIGKQK